MQNVKLTKNYFEMQINATEIQINIKLLLY